jgi:amino acid adenylation domain-containing protein
MNFKGASEIEVQTLRELIDYRAETQPNAVFLVGPETGRELTFQGLAAQSRLVCFQLRQMGLEPGDKIAFLMDNGLCTAQLLLGAMYSGFVAVPLNVHGGAGQLSYTLDHCDAKVVFVGPKYTDLLTEVLATVRRTIQVIPTEVDCVNAEGGAPARLPLPAAEDVALLTYTSGSTGQPKGAIHTHRTLLVQAKTSVVSHQLTLSDRSLLVLPLYHFNAECVTLIPALLSGGSVVVPHHFVVSEFWNWMDAYRCTWSALVPTIISQLLDWKDPGAVNRETAFRRIRFLRSSSAPLSPSLQLKFLDKFKLPLIQAMGSTEAGIIFSNPVPPGTNKVGSVGQPWGFDVRIVNGEGADLPPGEPGEILLRGSAITPGYYKDPMTTAPVLDADNWLHTGDIAYRDQDGYFFVVGRSRELIIKGGINIAPKQIDEVLESHPAVLEAAAVGVPDPYLGEDLVAFVVLRNGMSSDERNLLSFCETHLGHFKTPTRIHFVEDLPKGPSGKVQRLRLVNESAKPAVARFVSLAGGSRMPATDVNGTQSELLTNEFAIEQIVAEIWSELLAQPQIDAHSNFFELGGHSLLAIQCLSRLREKVPVIVSLTDFFEHATVAQLGALVRRRLLVSLAEGTAFNDPTPDDSQTIPLRDRISSCPLSPAQQRLWFVEQLVPNALAYNESEAVRWLGNLDVKALERAFKVIVGRHELLRSTIRVSDGHPTFVVHDHWPLEFKKIDLCAMPASEREAEVERLLVSEPRRPYQLEISPGIRTTLVRSGPQEHVFILMMHHIICDWSSVGVFWRELSAVYRAFLRDEPLKLAPLRIQHGDYAAWQQELYAGANFARDLAFWKETLKAAPELLELPADRPRPPSASHRGARKRFRIDPTQAEALRQLGRQEKTSLFTVFAAALNVLLHRYTGSEDILLGIPLTGRDRPELQSMIGFLLHTHVLRVGLEGSMTFSSLLGRVQKAALDLFTHSVVPFDLVVGELGQERNLSYSPLFQVMLNWRDPEQEPSFIGLEGLRTEYLLAESRTSKFDLTVQLTDKGDEISLQIEYSTDLFDEARIVRMVGHYQTLLRAVAIDPDQRLSDLPLLTEAERRQILEEWNRTGRDFPRDKCIHQLFETQAERTPEAVAVVCERQSLTYGELNARANRLAWHLRKLGVGPDSLVGICVERSLEMVIGLLGILKAGGAYVPLDPEYPKERLAYMLEDGQVRVALANEKTRDRLPPLATHVVSIDREWERIAKAPSHNPPLETTPESAAYIIYTSGSTGRPKGVVIPHHNVVRLFRSTEEEFGFGCDDVWTLFHSYGFDFSVWEMWGALCYGGRLVVVPYMASRSPDLFYRLICEEGVTVLNQTPSAFRQLIRHEAQVGVDERLRLRLVILAGEALNVSILKSWFDRHGASVQMVNMYGTTETTVFVTRVALSAAELECQESVIGRPLADLQAYIFDSYGQLLPIGVAGELHIGGAGVARGYLNRPELTAEKFIANPFSQEAEERLYKTGDLCRWLTDGNIEFLGRIDQQVKIRGFRIEPGEIESTLARHSEVRECAIELKESEDGEKRLVAYVVAERWDKSKSELCEELKSHLKQSLPDYMVPAAFVPLQTLPLTPNGKVDRKALPEPHFEAPVDESKLVAPRTPIEIVLARIWCEVLGLKQVGIHDNFFEVGGHSILAVKLISKINQSLGLNLSIPVFFQNPSIKKLAAILDQENHAKRESKLIHQNGVAIALVTYQANGTRPPLFFLHGDWAGGGLYCARLSQQLGEDQPFYALSPYRSGKQTALGMEKMATHYTAAIQEQTPHGPYLLGGYCIGATVAVEIARQLLEQGEEVIHLLLIEPSLLSNQLVRGIWPVVDRVGQILKWDLKRKIHYFHRYGVAFDFWLLKSPRSKFIALCHRLGLANRIGSSCVTEYEEDEWGREIREMFETLDYAIYVLASRLYNLRSLSVPTTVYFSEETPPPHRIANRAREISPTVRFETVPGDHFTCLTEHTSELADKLKKIVAGQSFLEVVELQSVE